eukprot:3473788-Pyramimonas_sp.AAC.2
MKHPRDIALNVLVHPALASHLRTPQFDATMIGKVTQTCFDDHARAPSNVPHDSPGRSWITTIQLEKKFPREIR